MLMMVLRNLIKVAYSIGCRSGELQNLDLLSVKIAPYSPLRHFSHNQRVLNDHAPRHC
jgi:hypothetical protein